DPFSQSLDTAWRTKLSSRKLYVNDLFITLVRRPLPGRIGVLQNLLRGSGRAESDARRMRDLVALNAARDILLASLEP
ncbi:hypothetical protein RGC28_08565, partial [Helicobacter pylori]